MLLVTTNSVIPIISIGVCFTLSHKQYLYVGSYIKIFGEEKYGSLTNQNVEEINMARKKSSERRTN